MAKQNWQSRSRFLQQNAWNLWNTSTRPCEQGQYILSFFVKMVFKRCLLTYSGAYIFLSPPLSFKRNIFILPFDTYVWLSYVGLLLLIIPALYYANTFQIKKQVDYKKRTSPNKNWNSDELNIDSWGDIFMLIVASFCMQGKTSYIIQKHS